MPKLYNASARVLAAFTVMASTLGVAGGALAEGGLFGGGLLDQGLDLLSESCLTSSLLLALFALVLAEEVAGDLVGVEFRRGRHLVRPLSSCE